MMYSPEYGQSPAENPIDQSGIQKLRGFVNRALDEQAVETVVSEAAFNYNDLEIRFIGTSVRGAQQPEADRQQLPLQLAIGMWLDPTQAGSEIVATLPARPRQHAKLEVGGTALHGPYAHRMGHVVTEFGLQALRERQTTPPHAAHHHNHAHFYKTTRSLLLLGADDFAKLCHAAVETPGQYFAQTSEEVAATVGEAQDLARMVTTIHDRGHQPVPLARGMVYPAKARTKVSGAAKFAVASHSLELKLSERHAKRENIVREVLTVPMDDAISPRVRSYYRNPSLGYREREAQMLDVSKFTNIPRA